MSGFVKPKCVVLGASGFIGSELCNRLLESGLCVKGFGRSQNRPDRLGHGVQWVSGDFGDTELVAEMLHGQDIIFHLIGASIPETAGHSTVSNLQRFVFPTIALLESCRIAGVAKVIFASSGGTVYGVPEALPINETSSTSPISDYGLTKLFSEKYLEFYRHQYAVDYVALRLSNPYGPFQSPLRPQGVIANLLYRALRGAPLEVWGSGQIVRDYVYIDDVVDAFVRAIDYDGGRRVMNVGSGVGRSVVEIIEDIRRLPDIPAVEVVHKPGQLSGVPINVLDSRRAAEELGWIASTPWQEGLQRTADWMRRYLSQA